MSGLAFHTLPKVNKRNQEEGLDLSKVGGFPQFNGFLEKDKLITSLSGQVMSWFMPLWSN